MSKNLGEIVISGIFVGLLLLKLDPFHWTMPDELQMLVLVLVIAAFGFYAGLLFREKARDEREALHIHRASRGAYLAGVSLLVVAIVVKSLTHTMDPWLPSILAAMIIAKMVVLIWVRSRN